MTTFAWIIVVILASLAGVILGFFIARKYMMNYFADNPPISAEMIRSMMLQMGQKPSEKRVRQILGTMKANQKK
ncbi:YneF family protein [Aerococcus christensenii]|uniref:YneF family protein n=1 Tax=Aerococcus christensenii TaxID=87541 RepID=UPI0007631715|nr:YneF family protein [Aerococcus christensenii]AMB91936.1 hypothetical protein AWM71_00595 [Aerococcus christensenii]